MGNNKKAKSPDEWKHLINDEITPSQFEQLCYQIVKSNGFKNVIYRGKGSDGGRDLEGLYVHEIAIEEIREKCWFQCKRQKQGVKFSQISTEVLKAQNQGVRKYFIVSNQDTTPDCKDDIKDWNSNSNNRCTIHDWSGTKFLDLLFVLPNLLQYYFPDEEIPPIAKQLTPNEIINIPNEIGKRFNFKFDFKIKRKIDLRNLDEVLDALKEELLELENIDLNIKALIYQKISFAFFGNDRFKDAILFLDKSLEISPENLEALLNKGYILGKIRRLDESSECYHKILSIDKNNIFALNNLSSNLEHKGEFETALDYINKALEKDTKYALAIFNKSIILRKLGRFEEAVKFLNQNKKLVENSIFLKQRVVELYIEILDLRAAFELNEEILSIYPNNINAINSKGVIYEKNSDHQKSDKYQKLAYETFEKIISKNRDFPLVWSNKAVTLMKSNKIDEALEFIDTALELFPENPQLLCRKGVIYQAMKDNKKALVFFEKALAIALIRDALLRKADILSISKKYTDAEIVINDFLRFFPADSDGWYLKGKIMKSIRKMTESKRCFENGNKFKIKIRSLLED